MPHWPTLNSAYTTHMGLTPQHTSYIYHTHRLTSHTMPYNIANTAHIKPQTISTHDTRIVKHDTLHHTHCTSHPHTYTTHGPTTLHAALPLHTPHTPQIHHTYAIYLARIQRGGARGAFPSLFAANYLKKFLTWHKYAKQSWNRICTHNEQTTHLNQRNIHHT